VAEILPVHKAQTISYIKLLDLPRGLLINFNVPQLIQGLHRVKHPAYD
jgi:GxxExxY protein